MKKTLISLMMACGLFLLPDSGFSQDIKWADLFITPNGDSSPVGGFLGGDGNTSAINDWIDWSIGNSLPFSGVVSDDLIISTNIGDFMNGSDWKERIRVTKNGNIGIGIMNPDRRLHIAGAPGQFGLVRLGDGMNYGSEVVLSVAPGTVNFDAPNFGGGAFKIDGITRNVGIGTANPTYKLHVIGDAAGTSWTNLSSREFKEEIQQVNQAEQSKMLDQLMKMNISTYRYKKEYGGDDSTRLGFIAEELPGEVLSKDGKGVDVYELLTFTIGAVKAQQEKINELEARLAGIK